MTSVSIVILVSGRDGSYNNCLLTELDVTKLTSNVSGTSRLTEDGIGHFMHLLNTNLAIGWFTHQAIFLF